MNDEALAVIAAGVSSFLHPPQCVSSRLLSRITPEIPFGARFDRLRTLHERGLRASLGV
jgi:hypothetical protein